MQNLIKSREIKMTKQLSFQTLMSVLIVGEIMTVSTGILNHMTTKEISLMIIGFVIIWAVSILVSDKIYRTVNR